MRRRIRALIAAILWAAILGRGNTPSGHAQTLEVPIWSGCIVHLDTRSRHCAAWAMMNHAGQHVYSTWHGTRWLSRTERVDVQSYPIFRAPTAKRVYTSVYSDGCFGAVPAAAAATGIPPAILRGLVRVESGGQMVYSADGLGSFGCMQMLPGTSAEQGRIDGTTYRMADPYQNVLCGARYLARLIRVYAGGNLRLGLAMYNGGPGAPNDAYASRVLAASW